MPVTFFQNKLRLAALTCHKIHWYAQEMVAFCNVWRLRFLVDVGVCGSAAVIEQLEASSLSPLHKQQPIRLRSLLPPCMLTGMQSLCQPHTRHLRSSAVHRRRLGNLQGPPHREGSRLPWQVSMAPRQGASYICLCDSTEAGDALEENRDKCLILV